MKAAGTFLETLPDRVVALAFLIVLMPSLLLVGLVLRANSDEPVLLREEVQTADGSTGRSYRFRTTGRGSTAFRAIGRFLRMYNIDECPALWSIVIGELRLRDILHPFKIR